MNDENDTAGSERRQDESDTESGIKIEVFGRTDVGLLRDHNEDNFIIADLTRRERSCKPDVQEHLIGPAGTLMSVCDGMGGAAAGEVASQMAVDTIYEMMENRGAPDKSEQLSDWLENPIEEASNRIYKAAREDRSRRGMGTTVTAAVLNDRRLYMEQVGDSRGYIIRRGKIVQVSKDQSLVSQLVDAGQLTPEEAENFEHQNIILQALGTSEGVQVDLTYVDLCEGDCLVMCSDGLSGMVTDDQILQTVLNNSEPKEICHALTDKACEGGGEDNITVIFARFSGPILPEPSEKHALGYLKLKDTASKDSEEKKEEKEAEEKDDKKEAKSAQKVQTKKPEPDKPEKTEAASPKSRILIGLIAAVVVAGVVIVLAVSRGSRTDETPGSLPVAAPPTVPEKPAPVESSNTEETDSRTDEAVKKQSGSFEPALGPIPSEKGGKKAGRRSRTGALRTPQRETEPEEPQKAAEKDPWKTAEKTSGKKAKKPARKSSVKQEKKAAPAPSGKPVSSEPIPDNPY